MKPPHSPRATSLLVLLGAIVSGSSAHAAFSQKTCPVAIPIPGLPVPAALGAADFDLQPIPSTLDNTYYKYNTSQTWQLYTNPNVRELFPYYGYFETEPTYDYVRVTHASGTNTYSGAMNPSYTGLMAASSSWMPFDGSAYTSTTIKWNSDSSVIPGHPGPAFGQINYKCKSGQSSTAANGLAVPANTRTDFLLLGTGDTIYLSVFQPALVPLVLSLDRRAADAGADFDLWVSTSVATPDASNFTWAATSSSPNEALNIPGPATPRTLYVGIHSFAGAGHVTFHANRQTLTHRKQLNYCTVGFTPTVSEQTAIRDFLRQGTKRLLTATNGNWFVDQYTLLSSGAVNCDPNCDICLRAQGAACYAPNSSWTFYDHSPHGCNWVDICGSHWAGGAANGWILAHELSHGCLLLGDQYDVNLPPNGTYGLTKLCGHTLMAGNMRSLCSTRHCLDGHATNMAQCQAQSGPNSDWAYMTSAGLTPYGDSFASQSPDPTRYEYNEQLDTLIAVY